MSISFKSVKFYTTFNKMCGFNRTISTGICFNQKVSEVLLMPRNFRRSSQQQEAIEQPKANVNLDENIKEIEDILFDNQVNKDKFQVDEILKPYKKMDFNRYFAESEETERKVALKAKRK